MEVERARVGRRQTAPDNTCHRTDPSVALPHYNVRSSSFCPSLQSSTAFKILSPEESVPWITCKVHFLSVDRWNVATGWKHLISVMFVALKRRCVNPPRGIFLIGATSMIATITPYSKQSLFLSPTLHVYAREEAGSPFPYSLPFTSFPLRHPQRRSCPTHQTIHASRYRLRAVGTGQTVRR